MDRGNWQEPIEFSETRGAERKVEFHFRGPGTSRNQELFFRGNKKAPSFDEAF